MVTQTDLTLPDETERVALPLKDHEKVVNIAQDLNFLYLEYQCPNK